jgi:hypothetical protein
VASGIGSGGSGGGGGAMLLIMAVLLIIGKMEKGRGHTVTLRCVKSRARNVSGSLTEIHPSVLHFHGGRGRDVPVEQTSVVAPGAVKLCMQYCGCTQRVCSEVRWRL